VTDEASSAPPPGFPGGPPQTEWMAGRTAIVTGGGGHRAPGGSVGYAISRLLAQHGARVAVVDRDPDAAELTIAEIRDAGGEAFAVIADVTDDEACARVVREAVERFGSLDTLVNCVASWSAGTLFDSSPERFDELVEANVKSAWMVSRHAVAAMGPGGAVVNISSVAAQRPGTLYGLAKASMEAMTRGAASLLGPRHIRVNCVQIGQIWTAAVAGNLPAEAREQRRLGVALQTEGTCWDPAYAVLFLASAHAGWISGQVLTVDGGGPYRPSPPPAAPAAERAGATAR